VINSSNAQYLGMSWLFPLPTHPTALLSVPGGLGVSTAPMIINGVIYAVTQYGQLFALNAANGNVLWTDVIPLTVNSTAGQGAGALSLNYHDGEMLFTTKLFGNTPTIWLSASDHRIYAINALTGAYEMNFSYYGQGGVTSVEGNNPISLYSGSVVNIVVDQSRGIVITSMLTKSFENAARCFYRGWNVLVTPPQLMWTAFCSPPQPGSNVPVDPNWGIKQVNSMKGAYIFKGYGYDKPGGYGGPEGAVNLKTLSPAVLNATLYNDWGYIQTPACAATTGGASTGATGAGWGAAWPIDEKTGIAYVNTGNKGPYNSVCSPGPNLWSAAIMAINETNGQWIWGFQAVTHDIWDYDCSWQQVLANETISGVSTEVLFKTCKSGYLYELNAATGAMLWSWSPPLSILPRCHWCYTLDPLNTTQMSYPFFNPSLADTIMYPSEFGASENAFSYSPALNYIFLVTHNVPLLAHYVPMNLTNYATNYGTTFPTVPKPNTGGHGDNSTAMALNAATGQMVWSYYIPTTGYRGGVTNSGNVVFLTLSSGSMLMLNAQTGALIKDLYIGGPLNVLPSIGATNSGVMEVIFPITVGSISFATAIPGNLVALRLQNVPAATTNTVTATVTTSVSAGATVTATTTATTTLSAGATVTVSGSASTVTAAGTSTGVDTTTLYGVAAVAVIFIIATGFLAMRGRKPTS
jgi:glucose dehydrogenase